MDLRAVVGGIIAQVLEGCVLVSRRFEPSSPSGRILVADIIHPAPATYDEPFEASTNSFDKIPGVESIDQSSITERTAFVGGFWVRKETGGGFVSDDLRAPDVVDLPGEGPKVEDAEDGHFDAEEHGGDADFDVRGLDLFGGFDGAGGG